MLSYHILPVWSLDVVQNTQSIKLLKMYNKVFDRLNNLKVTAIALVLLEPWTQRIRWIIWVCTGIYTKNTPRRPQLRGGRKEKPARSDLRAGNSTTSLYKLPIIMLCRLGLCSNAWGRNRGTDAMRFQSGVKHKSDRGKSEIGLASAKALGALPLLYLAIGFGNSYIRLIYTASVHVQLPQRIGCWCQTLLNQLGKFSSWSSWNFNFGNVCNSIELNDNGSDFIQSANLPAGIENQGIWCETSTKIHTLPFRQPTFACSAAAHWSRSTPQRWSEISWELVDCLRSNQ